MIASSGASYVWRNGTNNLSTTSQNYTATESGEYSVEVTASTGCKSTSEELTVTVNSISSLERIEAENYCDMLGIEIENSSEGTLNIAYIDAGDWVSFNGVDLTGIKSVKARVSSRKDNSTIEVRTGSETGDLIATISVTNTEGWQTWVTDSENLDREVNGVEDVYFVFNGGDGSLFNVNWVGFSEEQDIVTSIKGNTLANSLKVYPNPIKDEIHIEGASNSSYEIFDNSGVIYQSGTIQTSNDLINIESLKSGIYFIKVINDGFTTIEKIVLE